MASVQAASGDGSSEPASRRKLPPIEGLPKDRPLCPNCRRPLKFWTDETRSGDIPSRVVSRVFHHWRGYPQGAPIFDRLSCALEFAIVMFRAGYRRYNA